MELLKVSSTSKPSLVAGALANIMKESNHVKIQVIGAAALNQAIKAIAIARGYMTPSGKDIYVVPSFYDVMIDNENRTALRLDVYDKSNGI